VKILITGADGLLGSNIVRELIERNFSVRVLIQPGSPSKTLDDLSLEKIDCDLLGDKEVLAESISGCDAVFHCAAITDHWADPDVTWKVNLEGTRKVLDACVKAKIKKLIFVGSASSFQFGAAENPGDENGSFPPQYAGVAYMESKHRAMGLVKEYVSEFGLDAVIVAPTFMFGPYDSRPSSGELIRQFINRGMKFTSPGGRNFVHVRDVAKAAVNALEKGKSGECYILGGENLTYLDFFSKVAKLAGISPPRIVLPGPLILLGGTAGSLIGKITGKTAMINYRIARFSLLSTFYSPAKAIRELDMPQTPIERAIEESIQCLKEHGRI